MTVYENLMVTAMEECAEMQQEISKLIEYQQLRAVINKLIMDGHIKALAEKDSNLIYKNKLQKIEVF